MTENKENLSETPIPDVITRVGIENLGKRIAKNGLKCTEKQLQKIFIEGIIMFIIGSIGIALCIAFPPQPTCYYDNLTGRTICTNYGLGNWALGLGVSIGIEIVGFLIILAYILRREGFRRTIEKGRIKFAKKKAETIEKKMKKKQK